MANLVIDIGNTFTKIAVFKDNQLLHTEQHQLSSIEIINNILDTYQVHQAIISSVNPDKE